MKRTKKQIDAKLRKMRRRYRKEYRSATPGSHREAEYIGRLEAVVEFARFLGIKLDDK